jgi:SAM-dependent methyltransferase
MSMPVKQDDGFQSALYQRSQYGKGGVGRTYWDYRDEKVISLLDGSDRDILDAGCGEGITLQRLLQRFPMRNIMGLDHLDENVRICGNLNLPAIQGDLYNSPFPDGRFDTVLLLEVIEHLHNPELVVQEIRRILKAKGKLVLIFPNDAVFRIARLATGKFVEAFTDVGHVRQWTPTDACAFLRENGFSVFYSRAIPFSCWPISLHFMVGARKDMP